MDFFFQIGSASKLDLGLKVHLGSLKGFGMIHDKAIKAQYFWRLLRKVTLPSAFWRIRPIYFQIRSLSEF